MCIHLLIWSQVELFCILLFDKHVIFWLSWLAAVFKWKLNLFFLKTVRLGAYPATLLNCQTGHLTYFSAAIIPKVISLVPSLKHTHTAITHEINYRFQVGKKKMSPQVAFLPSSCPCCWHMLACETGRCYRISRTLSLWQRRESKITDRLLSKGGSSGCRNSRK